MRMESEETENAEELTIDLSKRSLKKIERATAEQKDAVELILDRNELQRLDNIDSYSAVKRLLLANNRLIRMESVSCLVNLTFLDISNNSLVCIEGLKDLKQLNHLNLSGNKIKTIDHLNSNLNLEYLNLSNNIIGHISDISHLEGLKELHLHNNEIAHLRQCEKNLPNCLEILTLNHNFITDLNEVSHLVLLKSLKELSFCNNPCLDFAENQIDFNYRPFVKNWCSSLVSLDGYPLDDIECLKAEWLYSQGRGRSFRPGEQIPLVKYLASVCPRSNEASVESEDEKKLRLILSKAQHHQQQLKKEELTGTNPLLGRHKLPLSRKKQSVMGERMVSSYHNPETDSTHGTPELMSRSLDGVLLRNSATSSDLTESFHNPLETATTLLPVPESLTSPDVCRSLHQFPTAKILYAPPCSQNRSPVPSTKFKHVTTTSPGKGSNILRRHNASNSSPSLSRRAAEMVMMSPSKSPKKKTAAPAASTLTVKTSSPKKVATDAGNGRDTSDEESEAKVKRYANPKKHKKQILDFDGKENVSRDAAFRSTDVWRAALCIQRHWRGYRTRNLNREVVETRKSIQATRMQDYIIKVASDIEATKTALKGHRKLQVLQMQAINALWKKMVAFQPCDAGTADGKNTLQDLAETCMSLNKQVEELQSMMRIMNQSTANHSPSISISTQTEIAAVHTPQGDERRNFPYCPRLERPRMLEVAEDPAGEPEENGPAESGSRTDSTEKEESVCLTPACQEGRDLRPEDDDDGEDGDDGDDEGAGEKTPSCADSSQPSERDMSNQNDFQHSGCLNS